MKNDWLRKFGDHLNPILVKELRQSLHEWSMLVWGGLLVVILLLGTYVRYYSEFTGTAWSRETFFYFILVTLGISCAVAAVVCCRRLADERRTDSLDLTCITTMTPFQVIWGKFASAMIQLLEFFIVAIPFAAFTCSRGDISWGQAVLSLLIVFLAGVILTALGLLIGGVMRYSGSYALVVLAAFPIISVSLGLATALETGVRGFLRDGWIIFVVGLTWAGGFLVLAQAAIANPGGNRMLPVRIYLFGVALILIPLIRGIWSWTLLGGGELMVLMAVVAALLAVIESPLPGRRVVAEAPRAGVMRWIFALFSSSGVSGVLFSCLLVFLSWLPGKLPVLGSRWGLAVPVEALEGFGYVLFTVGVTIGATEFLNRRFRPLPGIFPFMGVIVAFTLLPAILGGIIYVDPLLQSKEACRFLLLSPVWPTLREAEGTLWIGWILGAVGLVAMFPAFLRWFRLWSGKK